MSKANLTNLARLPLLILDYAKRHGMNTRALMRSAAISENSLNEPDSRVPFAGLVRLWRAVIEQSSDPLLGLHIGCELQATQLGIVGYAMSYSETLQQAFERLSRYGRIISEALTFDVIETSGGTRLTLKNDPALLALRHPIEGQAAAILTIGRQITDQPLVPEAVHLPTARPADASGYREIFRCKLRFDQPQAALLFSEQQLALPIVAADSTLSGYLEELAGNKLAALRAPEDRFIDAIRRVLWAELSAGKPDLERTGAKLGISSRTLQRRLRDMGLTYSGVLEELRRELSTNLLVASDLAIADVAFLLGYSEPSAFQRAFRRWQGVSPRQFKRDRAA